MNFMNQDTRMSQSVPVVEWSGTPDQIALRHILSLGRPAIFRGMAHHWQLVKHAETGFDALAEYLLRFDQKKPFQAMIASASVGGRLFYAPGLKEFNFKRMNGELAEALKILKSLAKFSAPPGFYIGSKNIREYLPGLEQDTVLRFLDGQADPTIWIGNSVTVATHNDDAENIACVAAGRRVFTLFPPEQEKNLYIGPKDITPAGRPISLVNLKKPEFAKFPLFGQALKHSQVAVLEAGDAVYIPQNWWHNVESIGSFNILVNFWWKR